MSTETETETGISKNWIIAALSSLMCVACILWNLEVPTRIGIALLTQQYMAFQLGLALTLCYLTFNFNGKEKQKVGWFDASVAAICFGVLMYAAWDFSWLLTEQYYRPWQITMIGTVITLAVMEGIRRRAGWALFIIVALFLIYALFADKVPGQLIGKELSPLRLVQYVGFDPGAVFASPLAVGTIIIVLFVFFGQLLFAAGGGHFFTDLAMALAGRSRGGGAKISIVGSALFGSISGSAVSNVVTTGVITIPLMRKTGYTKKDAGAIEAVASTGGQLTPPIMGAAAFLMAEFLEISYMTVAVAALLPALLYYFSVFMQVDLIAGRDNISSPDAAKLKAADVLRNGWHFLIPFGVLLFSLFWWRLDPEDSAILASVATIIVGFARGYNGDRLTMKRLINVFSSTGVSLVDLILVVAAAGFVIGILKITGLGFALTLMLVNLVSGNAIALLLISAVICIVLGMGMPTSGVYILLAALVGPSLVEAGINPIAAHLFILYFGMMSMITPPVALAAFAAATITKENPMTTGVAAMRTGWAAFFIPFVFVASPALLFEGEMDATLLAFALSIIGVGTVTIGIVGYWGNLLKLGLRVLFVAAGLISLPFNFGESSMTFHIVAAVLSLALAATMMILNNRRAQTGEPMISTAQRAEDQV
jgi:TRAP transporter 4TM/12TM fusion protein